MIKNLSLLTPFAFLCLPWLNAGDLLRAGDTAPLRFTIETTSETRSDCSLTALEVDGLLRFEQSGAKLALSGLVELRLERQPLPPFPARNFALFTNGDRLPLDPEAAVKLEENRLLVWPSKDLPDANEKGLSLYVPNVVLLFWTLPDGVDDAELFFAKLAKEPRKRDVVYLRNGDRMEGTVTSITGKMGCLITTDRRQVQTPWSKLAGVAWNSDRQARVRARKPFHHAILEGGARLSFADLRFDEKLGKWVGKTQLGPRLEFPASTVIALESRLGPAVYLSDLAPASYEASPYLGLAWPLERDAAVTGHALRLDRNTYDKGLGMHGACSVTYDLDGQYRRFECVVGLDPVLARRGRARLAVELDGKKIDLAAGSEITSDNRPLAVRLSTESVRRLTLRVLPGAFGDVQAHVNWAHARLIKQTP